MKIKVPIPVKKIVTRAMKEQMIDELKLSINHLNKELDQLQFQNKKLLNEAQKRGTEAIRIVEERIQFEQERRKEKINTLFEQLKQWEKLELGDEILHQTVEAEIDIKVGDSWGEIQQTQIIIKDGVIVEIREGDYQ